MPRKVAIISEYVEYSGWSPRKSIGFDQSAPDSPPTNRLGSAGERPPSLSHTTTRKQSGTSRAVSFSQYWKACTKVIDRMPPDSTLSSTTTATTSPPAQPGRPVAVRNATPAPWNCGIR